MITKNQSNFWLIKNILKVSLKYQIVIIHKHITKNIKTFIDYKRLWDGSSFFIKIILFKLTSNSIYDFLIRIHVLI